MSSRVAVLFIGASLLLGNRLPHSALGHLDPLLLHMGSSLQRLSTFTMHSLDHHSPLTFCIPQTLTAADTVCVLRYQSWYISRRRYRAVCVHSHTVLRGSCT